MSHLTKYTANYRCPDDINNFKLSVKLAEITSNSNNGAVSSRKKCKMQIFKWQEKKFSRTERDLYRIEENCITDLEKKYHLDVIQLPETETNELDIYSYTHEDDYCCESNERETINENEENADEEFDFSKSLLESVQNPSNFQQQNSVTMTIMADLGEYVETTWIKHEIALCSIKYDPSRKILRIYPDFTQSQPYTIATSSKTFQYFIDNISQTSPDDDQAENELIRKINAQKSVLVKQIVDAGSFHLPPKNQLEIHLFCEILWAKHFEYDSIYVQYFIDLPDNWTCPDPTQLEGLTHTCHVKNEEGLAHFGHISEIILQYNIEELQKRGIPKCPYIYFSIVSKDSWERYRTEGLTYKNLPIARPGSYRYELQCFRLVPSTVSGQLRRFFIGDCSNYDDITWIGLPKHHEAPVLNKYGTSTVGTGELGLRINVIHQSQAFLIQDSLTHHPNREIFEKLNSSSLVKSVEQVLKAFQRATFTIIYPYIQCKCGNPGSWRYLQGSIDKLHVSW